jgi:hypothetical protein
VSQVIVQICRSRLLAVSVLGERNGDDGRSMRRLTHWRLKSDSRAEPGGEDTWGLATSSATVIDPDSSESCCWTTVFC